MAVSAAGPTALTLESVEAWDTEELAMPIAGDGRPDSRLKAS